MQDDAVLKGNAEHLAQHTVDMVRQVRLAWVQAAVQEDEQAQQNIALLSDEAFFKKLQLTALSEEDQTAWSAALKGNSEECRSARGGLLKKGWAVDAVVEVYNAALDFGTKHAKKEAKREDVQKFLDNFPAPLREAWGLPVKDKLQKQRPAGWKSYCSVAYTLAWNIFKAHVNSSMEE